MGLKKGGGLKNASGKRKTERTSQMITGGLLAVLALLLLFPVSIAFVPMKASIAVVGILGSVYHYCREAILLDAGRGSIPSKRLALCALVLMILAFIVFVMKISMMALAIAL